MTCITVWCVTWHSTGQHDLWSHINFIITQQPSNTEITEIEKLSILSTKIDYVEYNRKEQPSDTVKFSSTEGKCQKGYGQLQSEVQPC